MCKVCHSAGNTKRDTEERPMKRRRQCQPQNRRRLGRLFATSRVTIPSADFRDAIANGTYQIDLMPLQISVAAFLPVVHDDESFSELVQWRRIPLFENLGADARNFVGHRCEPASLQNMLIGMPCPLGFKKRRADWLYGCENTVVP
jgi:hypothetical protein